MEKPKTNYLTIILISLVFVLFIACVYLLVRQSSIIPEISTIHTKNPVAVLPLVTSFQTPEPSIFSTTKTFIDPKNQYSFTYPSTYKLLTSIPVLFNGTMLDVKANCRGPILQNIADPRVLIVMEIVPADGDGGFCWSNGIFSKDDKWSADELGWKGTYFVMEEVKTTNTQLLGFIGLVNKETYSLAGRDAFNQILSTFKFTNSVSIIPSGWKTFKDDQYGIKFEYPGNKYTTQDPPKISCLQSAGKNLTRCTLEIIDYCGSADCFDLMSVNIYLDPKDSEFKSDLAESINSTNVIDSNIGGIGAKKRVYESETKIGEGSSAYYVTTSRYSYIIYGDSLNSTFNQILSTFKFTN